MILQHFTANFLLFLVKFKVLQFDLQTSHSKEERIKQNPCTHYSFFFFTLIISYLYRVSKVTQVNLYKNFPKSSAVSY